MTCPECQTEKPDGLSLALHRRVMHPVEWKAGQDAQREEIKERLTRQIIEKTEAEPMP